MNNPFQMHWKIKGTAGKGKECTAGVSLPRQDFDHLVLLALSRNISRTQVARKILQHYLIGQSPSKAQLMNELKESAKEGWRKVAAGLTKEDYREVSLEMRLQEYKNDIHIAMAKRGLSHDLAMEIIKAVKPTGKI
jgi:hypothetical protein